MFSLSSWLLLTGFAGVGLGTVSKPGITPLFDDFSSLGFNKLARSAKSMFNFEKSSLGVGWFSDLGGFGSDGGGGTSLYFGDFGDAGLLSEIWGVGVGDLLLNGCKI